MADDGPVPDWVLEKEAADAAAESLDDRQLALFPAAWTPFGADGYTRPTLVTTEGWTRLGAMTDG